MRAPITPTARRSRAFSLIELIVVIVILGLVAAIALPRVGTASGRAAQAAHEADVARLTTAIEMYRNEHGGAYPASAAVLAEALMAYSNEAGARSGTRSDSHPFGPYIDSIPAIKVGPNKGADTVGAAYDGSTAWHYNATTGVIRGNFGGGGDTDGFDLIGGRTQELGAGAVIDPGP
ncbi:MAG: type II secretion system protein [Planctomycetota bacterium]